MSNNISPVNLPTPVNWGGGLTNPMTAEGDIIVGGVAGVPTRLSIGAATKVLTAGATLPEYDAPEAGAVSSVFTRTGAVVATAGDYTPTQVGAAPAITTTGSSLNATVSLIGNSATAVISSGNLAPGTYLVNGWITILSGAAVATLEIGLQLVSGTGTWVGCAGQPGCEITPVVSAKTFISLSGILVVTALATIRLGVYNNDTTAATAEFATDTESFNATGLTILKVA